MDLGIKRLILFIVSAVAGVALTFGLLALINVAYDAGVTFARYGTTYFILTAIPFGLLVAVWLDFFMGTDLLPHVDESEPVQDTGE